MSETSKPHPNLVRVILINVIVTMIPFGYHLTALNSPQKILENFVNTSIKSEYGVNISEGSLALLWSFIVACQAIGALTGCFLSVPLGQIHGRKAGFMIYNNFFLLAGSLFLGIAKPTNSFECIIVGRLLLGVYSGCGMALGAAFIQECSPPEFRGMLSCCLHVFVMVGGVCGAVISLDILLGTEESWPFLLSLPAIFAFLQFFFFPFTVESPKWLHEKEPFSQDAMAAVQYYYGTHVNPRRILYQFDAEKAETGAEMDFWEAWRHEHSRNRILLGALVNFAQIFTGLMAITSYSTSIITNLGISQSVAQYATAFGSVFGTLFCIPTLLYIDKFGRRKMLIPSMITLSVVLALQLIFGVLTERDIGGKFSSSILVIAMLIFLIAYNTGPGPIAYFISGELAPANCRTAFFAFGISVNWLSSMISTFIFYPIDQAIGQFSFVIFLIPTTISTILLWWKLPETKTSTHDILDEGFRFLSAKSQEALQQLDDSTDFSSNYQRESQYEPLVRERNSYGSFMSNGPG